MMPDGFEVAMNYKVKINALGEVMDFETNKYDVFLNNNAESYKFMNFQLRTKETHEGDFARNGFVNMIQATDALLARLIVVHLDRLGAKHVISVHDCFRVNITEMALLRQAIKNAYMDLFGAGKHTVTEDLPMYFEGANKQLIEGAEDDAKMVRQFNSNGTRYLQKVKGSYIKNLIAQLGAKGEGAYYFDK